MSTEQRQGRSQYLPMQKRLREYFWSLYCLPDGLDHRQQSMPMSSKHSAKKWSLPTLPSELTNRWIVVPMLKWLREYFWTMYDLSFRICCC